MKYDGCSCLIHKLISHQKEPAIQTGQQTLGHRLVSAHMRAKSCKLGPVIALLALSLLPVAARAQNFKFNPSGGGPPVRDPEAIAILERVLIVLGGKDAQLQLRTASANGIVETADSQQPGSFAWEDDFTGAKPEFRKELHVGESVRVFASGHGHPAESHNGNTHSLLQHTALASPPLYLPGFVLAKALQYPHMSVRLIHDNDSALIHVETSWDLNAVTAFITPQHWYFDPNTFLPVSVKYRVPDVSNAANARAASLEFDDFRSVSGLLMPFHLVSRGPDGRTRTFTVSAAETNGPTDPRHFEVNGGGQ